MEIRYLALLVKRSRLFADHTDTFDDAHRANVTRVFQMDCLPRTRKVAGIAQQAFAGACAATACNADNISAANM